MTEWLQAHRVAGADIIEACRSYAANRSRGLKRITVSTAIDLFIKAKDDAGKSGNRVYGSKLKPLRSELGDRSLDLLTVQDWSRFFSRFEDPVTRNDIRKRAVTLCRWAQRQGHLSDEAKPEVEKTERAKERANPIGILTPEEFRSLLDFFRQKHPRHLAALVIAGFCGVRAEEIHGKRGDPGRRQLWKDIHLDRGFLSVTAAKENTPSSLVVHLCNAAVAWLRLCQQDEGPVCQSHAIDRIRDIAATNGMPTTVSGVLSFSYLLAVPSSEAGTLELASLVSVSSSDAQRFLARPDPLKLSQVLAHSADADRNGKLSLLELTRVIELYNTRNGTTRTGCYGLANSVNEDGFASAPERASASLVSLARVHSADSNRDGKISLTELTRVIELYNYRSGTTRTGQYKPQAGTEDGFTPGP